MRRSRSPKPKDKYLSSLNKEVIRHKDKTINTIADSFNRRKKEEKEKDGKRQNEGLIGRKDKKHFVENQEKITKKVKQEILEDVTGGMYTVNQEDYWEDTVQDMGSLNPQGNETRIENSSQMGKVSCESEEMIIEEEDESK